MTTQKRLYRSSNNKVIAGVIGGVGEYFDVDPTVLRLGYVVLALLSHGFPAILAYFIAVLVVPKHPQIHHVEHHAEHTEKHEHKEESKPE